VSLPPTEPAGPVALPVSPPRAREWPIAKSVAPFLVRMLTQDIVETLERGIGGRSGYDVAQVTRSRRVVTLQLPRERRRGSDRGEGKGELKSSGGRGGSRSTTTEDAEVIRLYLRRLERVPTYTEWVFSDRFPNAPVAFGVVTEGDEPAAEWNVTDFPLQTGGGSPAVSVIRFKEFVVATAIAAAQGDPLPAPYDDHVPRSAAAPLGPRPERQAPGDAKREGVQTHYVRVLEVLPGGTRGIVQWIDEPPRARYALEDAIDLRVAGVHGHMIREYNEWAEAERERGVAPAAGRGLQRKPLSAKALAAERKLIDDTGTLLDCCTTTSSNTQPLVRDDALYPAFGGTSVLMDAETDAPYFLHERCLQGGELNTILDENDADLQSEYAQQFTLARIAQRLARRACPL